MRRDLIPEDKLDVLDAAFKSVLEDVDIGFLEKVFGFHTRVTSTTFIQSMAQQNYNYLQPHCIRLMVAQQLTEHLANLETESY